MLAASFFVARKHKVSKAYANAVILSAKTWLKTKL